MIEMVSLLARKLRSRGVAPSPLPEIELIGNEFARLVEDKLRPLVKTNLGAIVLECVVEKMSEATARISVPAMIGVVELEDCDTLGLLGLDTDLAYHFIDLMLGGDPSVAPMPTARTFTGIDVALGRLYLDALLAAFTSSIESSMSRPVAKRFSLREQRQDVSQVRLAPDYVDVLTLSIALDVGLAARAGKFVMVLPLATLDVLRASLRRQGGGPVATRTDDLWRANMRRAAAASPVVVDGVLHRQRMALSALMALKAGDVLELPPGAVNAVQLHIRQPGDRTAQVATGQLGAFEGRKVIKLATPVDPRVRRAVERAL